MENDKLDYLVLRLPELLKQMPFSARSGKQYANFTKGGKTRSDFNHLFSLDKTNHEWELTVAKISHWLSDEQLDLECV